MNTAQRSTPSPPPVFFASMIGSCAECGSEALEGALQAQEASHAGSCATCAERREALRGYWRALGNPPEETDRLGVDARARSRLRAVFASFAERGPHRPLVLPSALKIEVTNRCNLRCAHCLAGSHRGARGELGLNEIGSLLAQAREMGVRTVALVGGEPLLRKDLPQIVDRVCNRGLAFSVSTNAVLATPELAAELKRPNLMKVSVSLDGTKAFHDELRGCKGAHAAAVRGIRTLVEAGIDVAVAMVVARSNWGMIGEVLETACAAGAHYFVINDLIPTGRGDDMRAQCLDAEEYRELTERMRGFRHQYRDRIDILWKGMRCEGPPDNERGHFFTSKCGAALTELTIDPEGFVLPCPFLPTTSENVRSRPLKQIWYHSGDLRPYQNRRNLRGGCGQCDLALSCSGCRARALAHTGDSHGPDIRCPRCEGSLSAERGPVQIEEPHP